MLRSTLDGWINKIHNHDNKGIFKAVHVHSTHPSHEATIKTNYYKTTYDFILLLSRCWSEPNRFHEARDKSVAVGWPSMPRQNLLEGGLTQTLVMSVKSDSTVMSPFQNNLAVDVGSDVKINEMKLVWHQEDLALIK